MVKSRFMEQSTNFHGLSRDLEFKMVASFEGRRMNSREMESCQNRKSVLFEKANCLQEKAAYSKLKDGRTAEHILREPCWTFGTRTHLLVKDVLRQKESAFTEVRRSVEKVKEAEQGNRKAGLDKAAVQCSPGSAYSFVWPNSIAGEPKSAFSKPAKCWEDGGALAAFQPLKSIKEGSPRKLSECIAATDLMPHSGCLASRFLVNDSDGFQLLSTNLIKSNPFAFSSAPWPKEADEQMQANPASGCSLSSSASWALLPPSFAPLSVAAQNWCAKCSLSFHMTSDLVLHMRSHHKKVEVSTDSQRKRRREEKLSCPVCQEYFRERHHLSRHMTSHN
ncbi:zinc finger protein 488 [Pantherophis guttatus]|uniref:Zinc finger protein 488 n=1 Tax=Pantherophis guttatus TaxID=94885 RepID=A0A6P9BKV0_PANGU|nr:zinc finger protein 488 [Pantherophis guttatus]XP_034271404.1 zinc finger protein 488 [Pantherophis guttatus]XP_034271414.1 zinc finger protein 488 [Pantherophis guttatus]XP_034271423.1 zinc finger protein 488 [Pantherophis guttatus]XP_034271434.1 zinc finger protein 488 [Pantherophis guttatus]